MASFNKVILMGNAGRDSEVRYTPGGMAICNISIATSKKRNDKSTGNSVEETQWHRLVFFDKLAEIAGQYVKKGKSIMVEGELKYGKYTDKDGVERQTTDIVVSSMQLLGGGENSGQGGGGTSTRAPAPAPRPAAKQSQGFDDMDDSIPF